MTDKLLSGAQDALNRMARADRRGTGCHLTADMIKALSCTFLAQVWGEEDPRTGRSHGRQYGGEVHD